MRECIYYSRVCTLEGLHVYPSWILHMLTNTRREAVILYWLGWIYLINTFLLIFIAVREVRRPITALTWLTISLIVPIIGFLIYLSSSRPFRLNEVKRSSVTDETESLPEKFSRAAITIARSLNKITVNGLRKGKVQLLINGVNTYEQLIKSLENAQKTIDVEYYIFRNDHIGKVITNILMERSMSGVQVRFIIDGWGSRKFSKSVIHQMMDVGIKCRTFFPLRFPKAVKNWNYRNHCKTVIIDGKEAFTGGINIGDEYSGKKPDIGFWRDTHVRILGDAVEDLTVLYNAHWQIVSKAHVTVNKVRSENKEKMLLKSQLSKKLLTKWSTEWAAELGSIDAEHPTEDIGYETFIQTIEGNPGIPTQAMREAFFICITQADHTIDISTPYFLPDIDIMMALKTAVSRGVRVRLLIPQNVDNKLVDLASRTFFGELLDVGVEIHLYNRGLMHAKQMTIDEEIVLIGAANYDIRSFRLNLETCELFYNRGLASQLTNQYENDMNDSIILRKEDLAQRSTVQRIQEQGARLLSLLM